MQRGRLIKFIIIFSIVTTGFMQAQENVFSHYFSASSCINPAHAGDTRFAQFQLSQRLQPLVSNQVLSNTMINYDQKIRNQRSGIGVCLNQQTSSFRYQHIKINYSHTIYLLQKYWMKGGLGISYNHLNTRANSYKYPDQYDRYGYTGAATQEVFQGEEAGYIGLSAGFAAYNEFSWLTLGFENLNRPAVSIIEEERKAVVLNATWGMLIPLDKHKRSRRIFAPNGGLKPYSSIGPVVSFYKNGPFHLISFGLNGFINPVFWGVNYRYNAVYDKYLSSGAGALNFMAGYRIESLCLAYSYDYITNRTPTNFKGSHELSLIYYLFSDKEDYRKNKLFPYPNQLMY